MLITHLLAPGDRVVVEQPTYDRTLLLLGQLGVELVPVPLEADGINLDALEAALAEGPIRLAHLIPNSHNPAGCTLSAEKRRRLVELADKHGFWIFEDDPKQDAVERRLDLLLAPAQEESLLDSRIQKVVELIRKEPDRNYSQDELAAHLGLSPSRLLHLFSEQIGVPYRRFRMWKRLMLSFELLHAQDNMTLAALDSGFADATHYSHAFRDTFGVNPAPVFRKIERFDRLV